MGFVDEPRDGWRHGRRCSACRSTICVGAASGWRRTGASGASRGMDEGVVAGRLVCCVRSLEAGLPIYRSEAHARHALVYGGHDPGVCGHGTRGWISALLGRLEQALFEGNKTLSLGRSLSHHGSLALAYYLACEVHYLRRDTAALSSLADEMLPFVTDHGSPLSVANATIFQGWALIANGDHRGWRLTFAGRADAVEAKRLDRLRPVQTIASRRRAIARRQNGRSQRGLGRGCCNRQREARALVRPRN